MGKPAPLSGYLAWHGMAVFTAAHGTLDSCSILLLRLRSHRGRGWGWGSRAGGLEGWRAASPKILFIYRPLVSCAVCTSPCSIQEMGSVVDLGGAKNAGDAGLLFYWPSAVCERQRRLKKKRRLTPPGRPKEQLRMAALRQIRLCICHHCHSLKAKQAGRV